MLYRIISESLVEKFPDYFVENGIVYTNAEALEKAVVSGDWFPLEVEPQPHLDAGQYYIKHYALVDNRIVLSWEVRSYVEGTPDAEM